MLFCPDHLSTSYFLHHNRELFARGIRVQEATDYDNGCSVTYRYKALGGNIMHRRSFLKFALVAPLAAQAAIRVSAQTPEPTYAPDDIAEKAVKTVETFIKRATSKKENVRLRAWEMLTENYRQNYLGGDPTQLVLAPTTVHAIKEKVTVEESGVTVGMMDYVVEVSLSGFINEHGLYSMQFFLTPDLEVDYYQRAATVEIPEGMKAAEATATITDSTVSVDPAKIDNKDVVIIAVSNTGSTYHSVQLFRLNDGHTVDDLLPHVTSAPPTPDPEVTSYGDVSFVLPGESKEIGFIAEPGKYVLIGTTNPDSLLGVHAEFTIKK